MTANDIDNAKNPLLKLALPALKRAAKNVRKQAIFHNTRLIVWQNGRVVKLLPNDILERVE